MSSGGSYSRSVREGGVVHRIYVRRARCERCGTGEALLPDFVLRRRLDSTTAVGAAVLAHAGHRVREEARALYAGVPARTVRSWRQRFAGRADELTTRFSALCAVWGRDLPPYAPTPVERAISSMGATWQAFCRRSGKDVPPPWRFANVIVGSQLISTRVDLPWPIAFARLGHAQGP